MPGTDIDDAGVGAEHEPEPDSGLGVGVIGPDTPQVAELSANCEENPAYFNFRTRCQTVLGGCYQCTLLAQRREGGPLVDLSEFTKECSGPVPCGDITIHGSMPLWTYTHLVSRVAYCGTDGGPPVVMDERILSFESVGCGVDPDAENGGDVSP
ncbi:hypothetical protein [Myxococcus hansupus]|uniref:hypothetical protein n=1 Tax=Pseudomyxococcus hansupus TaxID=1297742 RepID=UPI0005D119EF|nr:hypothetical protein [Myxococcus hansupus]